MPVFASKSVIDLGGHHTFEAFATLTIEDSLKSYIDNSNIYTPGVSPDFTSMMAEL